MKLASVFLFICAVIFSQPGFAVLEVGPNDFRISTMQGSGDPFYDGKNPAIAYNPIDHEYLVVWSGDVKPPSILPIDCNPVGSRFTNIYAQRINADTGELLGSRRRISNTCLENQGDFEPAVAFNQTEQEYLVVWASNADELLFNDSEIFGQRLSKALSLEGGEFRISHAGTPTFDPSYSSQNPDVVWNATDNRYFVVWTGTDILPGGDFPDGVNDHEIFGQLLDTNGSEIGIDDIRISTTSEADWPALTWNETDNEYLVVWRGFGDEILGQRLNGNGSAQGVNSFPISKLEESAEPARIATRPDVTWNAAENEYLVVWQDDNRPTAQTIETEVFGQLLDRSGAKLGIEEFLVSKSSIDGDPTIRTHNPSVGWNSEDNEYIVAFNNIDVDTINKVQEVYVQILSKEGASKLENDLLVSDMGGSGDNPYDAGVCAVAAGGGSESYLVVFEGDDDIIPLVDDEYEIFGQLLSGLHIFANSFEN